ncbi:MAG TPA: hypothetical protein VE111_02585, partial [Bradyrhizobium sp.]|nr:hypothetical protein [Bradyrhizobium sp.]
SEDEPPCFIHFLLPEKTNEKSHPWPKKAPNGINAATINGRVSLYRRTKIRSSSLRHHRLRENSFVMPAFSYEFYCVLAPPALSMRSGPFLCGAAQMTHGAV